MEVRKTHNVAEVVFNIVSEMAHNIDTEELEKRGFKDWTEIYVYPFHNGRENGYCFTVMKDVSVFVCENRNSDNITVTKSKDAFDDWTRVTEAEYKKREYFDYNEYYKAAQRVMELLGLRGRRVI